MWGSFGTVVENKKPPTRLGQGAFVQPFIRFFYSPPDLSQIATDGLAVYIKIYCYVDLTPLIDVVLFCNLGQFKPKIRFIDESFPLAAV